MILVALLRGSWFGVGSLGGVWAVLAGVSGQMFATADTSIAAMAGGLTATEVWAAVSVARQLTEQRVRRRVIRVLGQYTSPTIAARVADTATDDDFVPRRAWITCFFCDLTNFTSLSERIGPERTRQILNPCLNVISQTLIGHDALVNKFLGDGVMAFFNAPILPCVDHARHACLSAIECVRAIERLCEYADSWTLQLKVGIATGDVFAGDFGTRPRQGSP